VACEEKRRLIEAYTNAATELSNALTELHLRIVSSQAEHGRLQRIVSECELKLEHARIAFEKHTSEHGC
jgi:hypothetical protein